MPKFKISCDNFIESKKIKNHYLLKITNNLNGQIFFSKKEIDFSKVKKFNAYGRVFSTIEKVNIIIDSLDFLE
jgi:hypothetical protein